MLTPNRNSTPTWQSLIALANAPLLILISIGIGSFLGQISTINHEWISATTDPTIFLLVTLLFFSVRFDHVLKASEHMRFLLIAVCANFLFIPFIGYSIAALLLSDAPYFMLGLVIYFMSPCTDWFLGFTRIANGNTLVGSTLLPINMLIQLILYPVFLYLFTQNTVTLTEGMLVGTLLDWFAKPLIVALSLRTLLTWVCSDVVFEKILQLVSKAIPLVISLLVIGIFAANIDVLIAHSSMFVWMLLGVFGFFFVTFLLSEALSRIGKLNYPEHALLTMTVAARNAPLMLAITMVVLPDQPIVYASIVVGMLLEFPHLTLLTIILRRQYTKLHNRLIA